MHILSRPYMHRTAVVLVLAVFVACGGDSGTNAGSSDIAGSYSLRLINGATLPYVVAVSGADTATLIDDAFTLTGDSKYVELWHVQRRQAGVTTTQALGDTGTFIRRSNTTVQFVGPRFGVQEATISLDTLKLADPAGTKIYKR
ncbi:MAG: hypothetical protein JWL95_2169 [Gemmatimonadetes bacterium]|nr:hypothetical protein [Gemmatimonadota bacterium]